MVKEKIELGKLKGEFEIISRKRSGKIMLCIFITVLLLTIATAALADILFSNNFSDGVFIFIILVISLLSFIVGYKLYTKIFHKFEVEWNRLSEEISKKEELINK